MSKFYRVLIETPVWLAGAVISNEETSDHYYTIEDIWDTEFAQKDGNRFYEGSSVVEGNPKWFQRVYKDKFDKFLSKSEALAEYAKKMIS